MQAAAPPQQQQQPPVNGQVLSLISALSNTQNHDLHVQAIRARDQALSQSVESYSDLCFQLAQVFVGSDNAVQLLASMDPVQVQQWQSMCDPTTFQMLTNYQTQPQAADAAWIPFGQMAGLILKNALLRPPCHPTTLAAYHVIPQSAGPLKYLLLQALNCRHVELRAVASTILATVAVSDDALQPALHLSAWPELVPTLLTNLQQQQQLSSPQQPTIHDSAAAVVEGSLETIRKIMEDGPHELTPMDQDAVVPVLLQYLQPNSSSPKSIILALESLNALLSNGLFPNALVVQFNQYLQALSALVSVVAAGTSTPTTTLQQQQQYHHQQQQQFKIRECVCRSIVTLLEQRTEYLKPHLPSVCQFMMEQTIPPQFQNQDARLVALEACEFWLAFCSLAAESSADSSSSHKNEDGGADQHGSSSRNNSDFGVVTPDMLDTVASLLPQLIPTLLSNMVYSDEQQAEILARNQLDWDDTEGGAGTGVGNGPDQEAMRPVFHRSRAAGAAGKQHYSSPQHNNHHHSSSQQQQNNHHAGHSDGSDDGYEEDDEGGDNVSDYNDDDDDDNDENEDDEDGGNEWTLRKCSAASLDSLCSLYGPDRILPCLLPSLEKGLMSQNVWVQEASILALGAIAEGCGQNLSIHMKKLHPYLMNLLAAPETPNMLPQLKSISAWTIGRYAGWAVEQVQSGEQGHLLAQMTEVFMMRLHDRNKRVQIACCSAFGVLVEVSGDLMAPYLEPVYKSLIAAMARYQGRTLLLIFDLLGVMADYCGPATAERDLPSIYVPPLMRTWDEIAKHDPTDRTLLPLMESLASIAMTSGMNFQPYALECFNNAMCMIEQVTLLLTSTGEILENEEDVDPIICATDLLDGLVEGLQKNFGALVMSSQRYRDYFLTVLLGLCKHDIPGVRMSALALIGDLARHSPSLMEPALPQILQEAIVCMDPIQPTVSTNAVWALGEICVCCQGNDAPLQPFAEQMMQNLIALLMGNGPSNLGRGTDIPGLSENAAACAGRLAKVNPQFVARDLSRFILGWCDGMARISDPNERRDAFQGFIQAVYANPEAIRQAAANIAETITSILFAIVAWHIPAELPAQSTILLNGDCNF